MLSFNDKDSAKKDKEMSDVAYARELFGQAFPEQRHGSVKAALYAAYRFMKPRVEPRIDREFTMRRVRSLHEGKCRRVDGAELEAIKAAMIEEARNEQKALRARLSTLDAVLATVEADLDRKALAEVG